MTVDDVEQLEKIKQELNAGHAKNVLRILAEEAAEIDSTPRLTDLLDSYVCFISEQLHIELGYYQRMLLGVMGVTPYYANYLVSYDNQTVHLWEEGGPYPGHAYAIGKFLCDKSYVGQAHRRHCNIPRGTWQSPHVFGFKLCKKCEQTVESAIVADCTESFYYPLFEDPAIMDVWEECSKDALVKIIRKHLGSEDHQFIYEKSQEVFEHVFVAFAAEMCQALGDNLFKTNLPTADYDRLYSEHITGPRPTGGKTYAKGTLLIELFDKGFFLKAAEYAFEAIKAGEIRYSHGYMSGYGIENKEFITQLYQHIFQSHLQDLRRVSSGYGARKICPII